MPVTFTDEDIVQAQAATPATFTDADVAQVHPAGPTRHNDSAGKPKAGTPHADDGLPDDGLMGLLFTPLHGAQRIAAGVRRMGASGEGETRGGVADVIHGVTQLLSPYLPEAAVTAPIAFLSSLAGSKIGGETAKALTSDNASPGARELMETTGTVLGGGAGYKGAKVVGPKLSSGVQAATEAVRNAPDTLGRAARAVPDVVTKGLSTIEKAATLRPAVSDAIEMMPTVGAPIAAGARTLARGARTANRLIGRARTLGAEAPPTRGAAPAEGVAFPGAQDPAAVESRTPQIDTSTELTPERLEALNANRVAGKVQTFTESDIAPQPYPGQTDPAAVQPMTPVIDEAVAATPQRPAAEPQPNQAVNPETPVSPETPAAPTPAELLDEIAIGMAGKPFERLSAGEQTGVLRVAGRLATKMNPPAAEPVASAPAPSAAAQLPTSNPPAGNIPAAAGPLESQPIDNTAANSGPVSDVSAVSGPAVPAQRPLLEEPAYDRPVDQAGKPGKTDYQAAARTVKGRAMARVLSNPPAGPAITAAEARTIPLGDPRWNTIAKLAGVNPPNSIESLNAVFDHKGEIEGGRAQMDLSPSTPGPGAPAPAAATLPADGGRTPETGGQAAQPGEGLPAAPKVPASENAGPSATLVRIPGEDTAYPAQYRVRELADVQTSHNGQTFQPNPKYRYTNDRDYGRRENQGKVVEGALPGKFIPELHVTDNVDPANGPPIVDQGGNALGGNGRGMMLQRVYAGNPEGAAAYRAQLVKKAQQFGIDPEQVAGMKQPILVREVSDADLANPQDAITDLNKTGTQALRPAERARADARRVSPGTLDDMAQRLEKAGPDVTLQRLLSGPDGPQVLDRLVADGVVTKQELPGFVDKGKLTPAAQQRISKLMLGRFFRDPAQLDTIPPAVKAKLERLAGPLAKLEGAGEWNLMPVVQEALDLLDEAHAHGSRNLPDFIKQTGLFGESKYSADAVTMAKQLQRISAPRLAEQLKEYSAGEQYARDHAHAKEGLFGADVQGEPPNPRQSFDDAFGYSAKVPSVSTPATKPKAAAKPKAKGLAGKIGDQFTKD